MEDLEVDGVMRVASGECSSVTHRLTTSLESGSKREGHNGGTEINRKLQRIEELKRKVNELKCVRAQLQDQLSHTPTATLRTQLLDTHSSLLTKAPSCVTSQHELLEKASSSLDSTRQLECQLEAYRCAGVTVSMVEKREMRVRFDTSYRGRYFETFYIQLKLDQPAISQSQCTLPSFIPVTSLLKEFNNQEIKFSNFLDTIHSWLIAYIARREQAEEAMTNHSHLLSGTILSTDSCNFIQIPMSVTTTSGEKLVADLVYKHLNSSLPDKVRCSELHPLHRATIKEVLLNHPIPEALIELEKISPST